MFLDGAQDAFFRFGRDTNGQWVVFKVGEGYFK